jgi:hypothetical protein
MLHKNYLRTRANPEHFFCMTCQDIVTTKHKAMEKQKKAPGAAQRKKAVAKDSTQRKTRATSANDNQNQVDQNAQTTPGEAPKRKPVTNADEQKRTSNDGADYNEGDDYDANERASDDQDDYEGPNDPSKRGDDPDRIRREQPKMK